MDPQNGVFIQQQIRICKSFAQHAVLYWGTDDEHHWTFDREDDIPVMRAYFPKGKRIQNVNRKWQSIRKLVNEAFDGEKPDLIHLHIADNDQWVIVEYAAAQGIPFFLTEHWSGYLDGRFEEKSTIAKSLSTALIKKAKAVTAVSGFLADAIIRTTGRKDVHVISNSVDLEGVSSSAPSNEASHFGILADLDDKIKNISGVLRAFRSFVEESPKSKLTIVGGGKDEQKLKKLAVELGVAESVHFAGRFEHAESLRQLESVDTIIVNSRRETFSIVCLEAVALGKHLICTKCGGPETFMRDALVRWTNVEDDIDLLQAMREAKGTPYPSFEQVMLQVEPFLPEVIASQWQELYREVIR